MAGLVPAIHVFPNAPPQGVDASEVRPARLPRFTHRKSGEPDLRDNQGMTAESVHYLAYEYHLAGGPTTRRIMGLFMLPYCLAL